MIRLIGSLIKYSFLVVAILVLSHIVQIKGVTISQYVDRTLNWITGNNPAKRFGDSMSAMRANLKQRNEILNEAAEVSPDDQRRLDHVIRNAQKKNRK